MPATFSNVQSHTRQLRSAATTCTDGRRLNQDGLRLAGEAGVALEALADAGLAVAQTTARAHVGLEEGQVGAVAVLRVHVGGGGVLLHGHGALAVAAGVVASLALQGDGGHVRRVGQADGVGVAVTRGDVVGGHSQAVDLNDDVGVLKSGLGLRSAGHVERTGSLPCAVQVLDDPHGVTGKAAAVGVGADGDNELVAGGGVPVEGSVGAELADVLAGTVAGAVVGALQTLAA